MGYLDNTSLTVDAILTKRGRQLLAQGALNITKFAVSDDEVDYRLWDQNHAGGTNFYGEAIEKLPVLEAFADESQMMRHKLITLPRGSLRLPVIGIGVSSINLATSETITLNPRVLNDSSIVQSYTLVLDNSKVATVTPLGFTAEEGDLRGALRGVAGGTSPVISTGGTIGDPSDERISITKFGASFRITGKSLIRTTTSTITIFGNDTGGSVTIPITVSADSGIEGVTVGVAAPGSGTSTL